MSSRCFQCTFTNRKLWPWESIRLNYIWHILELSTSIFGTNWNFVNGVILQQPWGSTIIELNHSKPLEWLFMISNVSIHYESSLQLTPVHLGWSSTSVFSSNYNPSTCSRCWLLWVPIPSHFHFQSCWFIYVIGSAIYCVTMMHILSSDSFGSFESKVWWTMWHGYIHRSHALVHKFGKTQQTNARKNHTIMVPPLLLLPPKVQMFRPTTPQCIMHSWSNIYNHTPILTKPQPKAYVTLGMEAKGRGKWSDPSG